MVDRNGSLCMDIEATAPICPAAVGCTRRGVPVLLAVRWVFEEIAEVLGKQEASGKGVVAGLSKY